MDELLGLVSQLLDYIDANANNLNAETQAALAEFLAEVMQFIAEQSQQPAEGLTPQIPQLEAGNFPSSNVNAFKYDPNTKNLLVQFHDKDNAAGPIYNYQNVPKYIYDIFSRGGVAPITSGRNRYHEWVRGVTPSLGAAMYHLIRTNYPYQRVS